MKAIVIILAFCCAVLAQARTVETGTFVCNPGVVVSVPLAVDKLSDVGAATFVVNYDSTIVACLGVDAGAMVDSKKMTYADTGSGQIVVVIPSFIGDGGEVFRIRFFARDGTAGQFSDVTVAEAQFAAKDGVTDLSESDKVVLTQGMVRVVSEGASVQRLEEAFVVWAKTSIKDLTLADGDAIQASDDGNGISVSGNLSHPGVIPVKAPLHGWHTGRYALLTTTRADLDFRIEEADEVGITTETANGRTTYYADIKVNGELEVEFDGGELDASALAAVRSSLKDTLSAYPALTRLVIKGRSDLIPLTVDLGIFPFVSVDGNVATVVYTEPALRIEAFDPKTGLVRIKITPGDNNVIRNQMATGCIHVYGTSNLGEKMRYISHVSIDVSRYLKDATKGEADLTVAMGTHTFLKVKAELANKKEGDTE